MSKPRSGALFTQAWVSEISGVTRRPSWLARKMSSRPPMPSVTPAASTAALLELCQNEPSFDGSPAGVPPRGQLDENPAMVRVSLPPAPAVDIGASIALAQLADDNALLRAQITEMASRMARLQREVLEASEQDLVKLALAIAQRVVGRELSVDPTLVVLWAREAIDSLAARDGVVIAVARDVRDGVPVDAWSEVGVEHRVQTDGQLPVRAIEVRTPDGTVATGVDARLAAVAQALGLAES